MPSKPDVDPEIDNLFRTIEERGFRKADLGRLLGLDSSQITRISKGTRRLQRHEWKKIEDWLSLSLDQSSGDSAVAIMPGLVPLYGWAGVSSEEKLIFSEQTLLGAVPRHPNQLNVRGAFALRVHDEGMVPRYEPGEVVYLSPNQWPSREQDCVLVTSDGFGYLARFVNRADGQVTLRLLNGDKTLTFGLQEVAAVHAVVGRS